MITVDFETHAIADRPNYPPIPVGVAIRSAYGHSTYDAWGHPTNNVSTLECTAARNALKKDTHWLCWNAPFDACVAVERLGIPMPEQIDDAMVLAFLLDPYGGLGLKECAERYLEQPPDEANAVRDWLYDNKVISRRVKTWQAHIAKAPGSVVSPYAIGDVQRTHDLFGHLRVLVREQGMWGAYERERDIMPMLIDNEIQGIPIAKARLLADTSKFEMILYRVEKRIYRALGGSFNLDANDELADRLEAKGYELGKTPTGKRSVAKASLDAAVPNGRLKGMLLYHSALTQALRMYMRPWAGQMGTGSVVHVHWNQVRNYDDVGARTGRMSSSPNLQNLTTGETRDNLIEKVTKMLGLRELEFPEIRTYVEAPRGYMLFGRDYRQQELRMLAHAEDGPIAKAYRDDPDLDVHNFVKGMVKERTGRDIPRKHIKNINFAKVYGAGVDKLCAMMEVSREAGGAMIDAYNAAMPSIKDLTDTFTALGRPHKYKQDGRVVVHPPEGITTIGGRHYDVEKPRLVSGRLRTFEYKLFNYWCQGSSADQTKEAMRNWWSLIKGRDTRFLLGVHDELVGMAPTKEVKRASALLDECMVEAFSLDVPTYTDGKIGKNWGVMK